ncbi:alpha-galactosidase [Paenibacillus sp. J5C2022]|uniref:alpha-galactosidase n=1 Tax=Paenibacillus sp. J5C2022 TaxID=2977129 RepID=UPI00293F63BD|nr:alpha-galactosidase [Paenibacillus sp. J5C2022]
MTPISMRGHAAMSGNFGYELDLTLLAAEDKAAISAQIALYKQLRMLVQSCKS